MPKKILITGGNGYIAQSLYTSLKDLYSITLVNRSTFDVTNQQQVNDWFADKYFDVLIHTAISGGSRLKTETVSVLDQNLQMYYNLLNNKDHYGKFITFGSGAELFSQHTPYGLSKHIIRMSLLEKDKFYNIRIFAVFDEHELDTRFIKANILRYIKKEPMQIFQDKKMDFFYMEDFIQIVRQYIEQTELPKEINCTYKQTYNLSEIADFINTLGTHRVNINIQSEYKGIDYFGKYSNINIPVEGLFNGIQSVYEKLSCKK